MHKLSAALLLVAVSGCNCDELVAGQSAEAELSLGDDVTPPASHLEAALGSVAIGSEAQATFKLASVGNLALQVASVALVSDPQLCPDRDLDFVVTSGGETGALDAGKSRDVVVTFAPSTGQPGCAVLAVTTDDATHPVLRAVIRGQGDAAALCTARTIIDFGDVLVGSTANDTMTLESCGTRPLQIVGLETNSWFPPFAVDALAPTTLAPGQTVDVPVHFSPTTPGRHSVELGNAGAINVVTDLMGQSYVITLVGNATTPPACEIDVAPALVNFGYVPASTAETVQVALRNLGQLACTLTSLTLADGADEFSFTAAGFTPGMTLAPLAALDVAVTFTAPATQTNATNTLVIVSDDLETPTLNVPLQAQVPPDSGCFVDVTPSFVDFGAVQINTLRARELLVENISEDPCFIDETRIAAGSNAGFMDTSSDFGMIMPGNSRTLTVGFRPTSPGSATGTFQIDVSDQPFGGTTTTVDVPLSAFTADPGICVAPRVIDFGNIDTTATQTFRVSACAAATIDVHDIDFSMPDAEITMPGLQAFPLTLAPGDFFDVTVQYAPVDEGGDTAEIIVHSSDLVTPEVPVSVTGGHTIVPVEAGRYLYFWQIPNQVSGGDVMKVPLQGDTTPYSFWGPRSDRQCAGCHSVSPDGKYIAVIEVGFMRFVEAETNLELFIGDTQFLDPTSFSWRPNINTAPPYQFAYSDGADVRIGSLFDGEIGPLAGADDGTLLDTMPTWGSDGKIAFVRGATSQTTSDGSFGLQGPTDMLLVDEDGGVAEPIDGASQNGMANYYPAFSPNGQWIAFTQSPAATSTIAATDARLRMAKGDNSGTILTLDNINSPTGPSSYATWSVDGTFLSFSSQRAGGAGNWDIYLAPMDPLTGADGAPFSLVEVNTADFEHAAQWSP